MAEIDPAVEQKVTQSMGDGATAPDPKQEAPRVYKLMSDTKIPVSKFEGPLWKSRRDAGRKLLEPNAEAWKEAEAYYTNSQMNHRRDTGGDQNGTASIAKNKNRRYSMTDNIVYSTVNAVIPATYAKNPTCEVTMFDDTMEEMGVIAKHLINRLFGMRAAPGLNIKPKMSKAILRTEITNEAWIMVGYTQKEFSADQARQDIEELGKKLVEAKLPKEIEEIEGQLMALEEAVDLLDPPGPFCKSVRAVDVLIDPNSVEDDFSDANWKMVRVMFPTPYLNAKFREKNSEGQYVSAYKGTHVVDATATSGDANATQKEIDSFKMLQTDQTYTNYGYRDQQQFDRAKMTACWYVFDRVKRRFYLYADNDWTWPIWVFDDPYHLPNFYPLHRLQFHTDPLSSRTKGEVSHYLDQQDAINTIDDAMNRARQDVNGKVLFDSNAVTIQDVTKWLNDGNDKALGIKMPDGVTDLNKLFMAKPLPAFQYKELWDKGPLVEAANRISGVGAVLQGSQFKTNTTNGAIDAYNSTSNTRIDSKTDAIEDFIGAIAFDVLFLCMQFMDQDTVFSIIGQKDAAEIGSWTQMEPQAIRNALRCTVAGGSTQKPTSAEKKKEALAVGQILGQFSAVPATTIVLLKLFERAFDGIAMTSDDWEMMIQSVQMQQQSMMNPGAAPGAGGSPAQQQQGAPSQGQGQGGGDIRTAAVAEAVKRGIPQDVAEKEVDARLKQQQ